MVISDSMFLVLEIPKNFQVQNRSLQMEKDSSMKYIGKLVAFAGLGALEQVKKNVKMENNINFYWKYSDDFKDQWVFSCLL